MSVVRCWCDDRAHPVCNPECDLVKTKHELETEVELLREALREILDAHNAPESDPDYWHRYAGLIAASSEKQAAVAERSPRTFSEMDCECENPRRDWYLGRDGHAHCEQCDGREKQA